MRWLRHLVASVVLVPLSGCILFVPDYDPVENCPIKGETACAACLRTNCQAQINTCCGTEECREESYSLGDDSEFGTTMAALDVCGGGDPTKCADQLQSAPSSAAGEAVKTCVQRSCGSECVLKTALTKWSCSSPHGTDPCSSCIYENCDSQLTSCCGEGTGYGTCSSLLQEELTACTVEDTAGCATVKEKETTGKAGVVRACIKKSCASQCFGNGRRHQSCTLRDGGNYCTCMDSDKSEGDECSTTALPKSHCFFQAEGCMCGYYTCLAGPSGSDCQCKLSLTDRDGTGAASRCNGSTLTGDPDQSAVCCISLGKIDTSYSFTLPACHCTLDRPCAADEYPVLSCDKSSFLSAMADLKTDSCSQ